jgi:hypothetical protein
LSDLLKINRKNNLAARNAGKYRMPVTPVRYCQCIRPRENTMADLPKAVHMPGSVMMGGSLSALRNRLRAAA